MLRGGFAGGGLPAQLSPRIGAESSLTPLPDFLGPHFPLASDAVCQGHLILKVRFFLVLLLIALLCCAALNGLCYHIITWRIKAIVSQEEWQK